MKTKSLPFKYRTSRRITTWGYTFDSLTELKFAVSVMDEYEFLRAPVSIYYHPGTRIPSDQPGRFHRRYTPDFLIRHRQTGEAFLIEIKPRIFEYHPKLISLKTVAENYIQRKGYDWKYKVVFDDEIVLSAEHLEEFQQCCRLQSKCDWKLWFDQYNSRFNQISTSPQFNMSTEKRLMFVLYGHTGLHFLPKWAARRLIS